MNFIIAGYLYCTIHASNNLPAVYMRADTRRKENNMKKIATNFQLQCELMSDLSLKLVVLELPL